MHNLIEKITSMNCIHGFNHIYNNGKFVIKWYKKILK